MFSKALSNMIQLKNFDALEILSHTAERLSQGEILQIEKALKKEMNELIYYKMVSDKTASLFSASCEIGAITAGATKVQQRAMANYGEKLGIAFQIRDDLFDISGSAEKIGKPVGFDVKKNMLTLPMVYVLSNANPSEKKIITRKLNKLSSKRNIKELRRFIMDSGGIDYTNKQMKKISNEAIDSLHEFPDSEYKNALIDVVKFNFNRKL